jgi:p-aminobenzoyl-glutamate transporter AbgT
MLSFFIKKEHAMYLINLCLLMYVAALFSSRTVQEVGFYFFIISVLCVLKLIAWWLNTRTIKANRFNRRYT